MQGNAKSCQSPNMAITSLSPGLLRIDRQIPTTLQLQFGTQTDTITSEQVSIREGVQRVWCSRYRALNAPALTLPNR